MRRALCLVFVSAAVAACATQSFQPRFTAPAAPKPSVVVSEATRSRPREERPVVVGLTSDPLRLFAWDLKTGLLWEKPVAAKSAPLVAADAIVLQEEQGLVVRDLATGEVRTVVDEHASLIGADGQGSRVVVSMAQAAPNHPGAVALVDGSSLVWKQLLALPVGTPALFGEYVWVPWATQRLSVLAANDGEELGRFHYTSTVMGHARVAHGRLYVGQLGLVPVDQDLLDHPKDKRAPYTPFKRSLPGQPPLLPDGYVPVPDPDNASHRLQVTWQLAAGEGPPSSENDLLLLRFYRMLFALNASSDEVRWVRTFEHDVVGAAMQPAGMWVVDAAGQVRYLDSAGTTQYACDLGRSLRVAALRPGDFTPAHTLATDQAGAATPPSAAKPVALSVEGPLATLREQLFAAATLGDDRLGAARAYAATYLARFQEPEVTGNLVELCAQGGNPEPLRAAACAELVGRKNGQAAVLQALRVRASFLEGTSAPPVGPLSQAAAKMDIKQAGPLLVSHIEDPNTPARDLVAAFQALEDLSERSSLPSVERFVRLHHAEPQGSELGPALGAALHLLGALHARPQRATLADIAGDTLTPRTTRDQAQAALVLLDTPVVANPPPSAAKPEEAAAEPAPADEVQTDPRVYALTSDMVKRALSPLRQRLGHCLTLDPSRPHSGRTSLVVDGTGHVEGVFVLPSTLQACVEPVLREARFAATRLGRQRITHVFYGENAKPVATPPAKARSAKRAKH
jgi:hypothetical protein